MNKTIRIMTDSGYQKREGKVISRTAQLLAVTPAVLDGKITGKFTIIHIPTGEAVRSELPNARTAERFARAFYSSLSQREKKWLASDDSETIRKHLSHSPAVAHLFSRGK